MTTRLLPEVVGAPRERVRPHALGRARVDADREAQRAHELGDRALHLRPAHEQRRSEKPSEKRRRFESRHDTESARARSVVARCVVTRRGWGLEARRVRSRRTAPWERQKNAGARGGSAGLGLPPGDVSVRREGEERETGESEPLSLDETTLLLDSSPRAKTHLSSRVEAFSSSTLLLARRRVLLPARGLARGRTSGAACRRGRGACRAR